LTWTSLVQFAWDVASPKQVVTQDEYPVKLGNAAELVVVAVTFPEEVPVTLVSVVEDTSVVDVFRPDVLWAETSKGTRRYASTRTRYMLVR